MHWKRWRNNGDVNSVKQDKRPAIDRWRDYIERDPATTDCWMWTGPHNDRYGYISVSENGHRRQRMAHLFVYEQLVGPVPAGLELDHLCRVKLCVNPAHLEPVTHMENVRRGLMFALKTQCLQGHDYSPENTRWGKKNGKLTRICRTCERKWKREYARRRRAAGLKA